MGTHPTGHIFSAYEVEESSKISMLNYSQFNFLEKISKPPSWIRHLQLFLYIFVLVLGKLDDWDFNLP